MIIRGLKILGLLALGEMPAVARLLEGLRANPELYTSSIWDAQYRSGKWRGLGTIGEEAHNLTVASYAAQFHPNGRILDVGCGSGGLAPSLRRFGYARYVGLDISQIAIEAAAQQQDDKTAFQVIDGNMFETKELFDVVIFNETLYYFADPLATMARYSQLLAPGGVFIVSMAIMGIRDGLLKQRIWRYLQERYAVREETAVYRPAAVAWTVRVLASDRR